MQSCCRIVLFGNGTELANGLWTQLQNGQLLQLCTKDERPVKGLVHVIRMVFISFTYSDSLHADRCLTWAMVERALFFFWRRRWQISTPTRTRQAADLSLRCSIADNWQQMISEDVLAEDKLPQSRDIERQNASKCIKLPVCARMCEVPCRNGHSQSKRGKSSHDWWSFAWNPFLNMLHMLLEVLTKHLIWNLNIAFLCAAAASKVDTIETGWHPANCAFALGSSEPRNYFDLCERWALPTGAVSGPRIRGRQEFLSCWHINMFYDALQTSSLRQLIQLMLFHLVDHQCTCDSVWLLMWKGP